MAKKKNIINFRNVLRKSKTFANIFKIISKSFLRLIRFGIFVISLITGISGNIIAFITALVLGVCVLGTSIVVITEDLTFVVDPSIYGQEGDKKGSGKHLTDYEKWVLMANALDRDLMESDYDSMDSMKQFFDSYKIMGVEKLSKEYPAKWVDIFLLIDEIYSRPEVNGDSYSGKIASEFLWGSWQSESGFSQGTGTRLTNSYVRYEKDYSSNCCIPLGIQEEQYIQYYDLNGYYPLGGTYICKQEFPDCPDEQRGIMGGSAALFDHKTACYFSEGNIMRRSNSNKVNSSDAAYQYLSSQTLPNYGGVHNGDKRGYISWLPDVFYNFAMINRVAIEGYDRDTQNPTSSFNMANKLALDELASQIQMTPEEVGLMADIIYDNGRFSRENVELWPNNPEAKQTDYVGALACVELILLCEGYLDEMANAAVNNPKMVEHNYAIGNYFLGDTPISNKTGFTYKEDSYYGRICQAIESGSLKRNYPEIVKEQALKLKNYSGYLSCLGLGDSQKTVRLLYAVGNYCKGKLALASVGRLITAYYNYQDETGDYRYRLYEVDLGDDDVGESYGTGNGPFGLPYYNEDGTVNELAVIAANNIFFENVTVANRYKDTITIPDTYTVNVGGDTATFQLNGGEYPNFWSTTYNGNASGGWGQCTWWSKGRAMLYLYENVSKDQAVWGICNPWGSPCKYAYISGNGNEIAFNINNKTGWGLVSGNVNAAMRNTVASSKGFNHTWFIEAVDEINGRYYMSHGNFSTHYYNGFYPNGCLSKYVGVNTHYQQAGTGKGYVGIYCVGLNKGWVNQGVEHKDISYALLKGT